MITMLDVSLNEKKNNGKYNLHNLRTKQFHAFYFSLNNIFKMLIIYKWSLIDVFEKMHAF